MSTDLSKLPVQMLRKIPIFKGLSPSRVKSIFGLCMHKSYKLGSQVCRSNSPSDEIYILISGQLSIVTGAGIRVATIFPVTTGEMGVITGEPRSATVEASKQSNIFVVKKRAFVGMLSDGGDMRATVHKNIIDFLSVKLNNDNVRLRDQQIERNQLEEQVSSLQCQLLKERSRSGAAVEMAAEQGDIPTEQVEMRID